MPHAALKKSGLDSASVEAEGIQNWSEINQMTLNILKTWEMVVQSRSTKPLPTQVVQALNKRVD